MEEILASIRRIMADDEQPSPQGQPAPRRGEASPAGETRPRRPAEPRMGAQRQVLPDPPPVPRRSAPVPVRESAPTSGAVPAQHRPARPAGPPRPMGEPAESSAPPRPWLAEQDEDVFAEAAAALRQARHEQARHEQGRTEQARYEPRAAERPRGEGRPPRPATAPTYADLGSEGGERPVVAAAARPMRPQPAPLPSEDHEVQFAQEGHPQDGHLQDGHRPDAPSADGARRRDLLSPNADAAVMAAFRNLGDVLLPQKERTVEDLVKEILRPMLKDWLDANLPGIVEDLVRAEIERVARRQR